MKKRKRVLAGFLALLLVLTSFTWDFGNNVMVANADDATTTESVQPEKINFDNIDVTTLDAKGFTSTKFTSSTKVEGQENKKASEHWFSGDGTDTPYGSSAPSGKNIGIKPKTNSDNDRYFLYTPYTYDNFSISTEIYYGAYAGVVIGEKNVYPKSDGTSSSIAIFFNNGRLHIMGSVSYSTAQIYGTSVAKSPNGSATGYAIFNNGQGNTIAANKGKAYTLNVKKEGNKLTVWISGHDGYMTINITDSYKTGTIALQGRSYGGDSGGFKSLEVRNLDATGYVDFDHTDVSKLTDFTATQLERGTNTIVGNADQAVSSLWYSGIKTTVGEKTLTSSTSGLKPKTAASDKTYDHLLNYKNTYENFKFSTEMYIGDDMGIRLGAKNTYPTNSSSPSIYLWIVANGCIGFKGAFDGASGVATGTDSKWVSQSNDSYYLYRYVKSGSQPAAGTKCTLNVEMQDGVLTVWFSEYNTKLTVNVSKHYPQKSNIALWSGNYASNPRGFKSFAFRDLDATTYDFNHADVSTLTDFTATQLEKGKSTIVGTADQPVSSLWYSGAKVTVGEKSLTSTSSGLKPKTAAADKTHDHLLNYKNAYENFKFSTEINIGDDMGIRLGAKNSYPADSSSPSIYLWIVANGCIGFQGAFDGASGVATGTDSKWVSQSNGAYYLYRYVKNGSQPAAGTKCTLNVEMQDGTLTVWFSEYNTKLTVNVSKDYPQTSNIALWSGNYATNSRGFKSFVIQELPTALNQETTTKANVGDSFAVDFKADGFKTTDLNTDFNAYYINTTDLANTVRKQWKPSVHWTNKLSSSGVLLPTYKNANDKETTLLTYNQFEFENVEITTKHRSNYLQYGVMIAPKAELVTADNGGVKVWVESTGIIKATGAIDAGSASATGGYVKINGSGNSIAGYEIAAYKNAGVNKESTLHVQISGKVMTIWLDEFAGYKISVNLTDEYVGGVVSLYATGNQTGGLSSFAAEEIAGAVAVEGVYSQSFSTMESLDELTEDFNVYTLDSAKNKPEKVDKDKVGEVLELNAGKLKSNRANDGDWNDRTNMTILTLKDKEYKNFELTLKYEQGAKRYGVMFGTEDGEFAYTQKGDRLEANGGAYVYTESEGYRNVRGSLYASSYTNAKEVLHRDKGDTNLASFWWKDNNKDSTVSQRNLHTMTIRVVGDYMTMVIDHDEASRVTVRLADYEGGFISFVTSAKAGATGAFAHLTIRELDEDAELGAEQTQTPEGFGYETLTDVDKDFDAYYLADATVTSKMEKVDIKDRWYLNNGGILTRTTTYDTDITWRYAETKDVDVLTYTKQQYTDFELTYTYQQTARRLGVVIGGDMGVYPLSWQNDKLVAEKGAIIYLENEGYSDVKGHLNNMTDKDGLLYRNTSTAPEGFRDADGKTLPYEGTLHTVKVVVKDKQLYIFIDGGEEPTLFVNLGDNYTGGYVSLFAHANSWHGFKNFTITDKVTTELPKGGGTSTSGNTFIADFNAAKFDDSAFTTYYLAKTKGNADGSMEKQNFEDQWTIHNGALKRNNTLSSPSSKNLEEFEYDDSTKVSVLTYNKKMTDFIATYSYQKSYQRLMFMFGTEMGKFALAAPETTQRAQGVLLYPENDLGAGGGLVSLGNIATYNSSMRPLWRELVKVDGYHEKGNWSSNVGTWHTMTVAVINNHCYIYLDDYGMIADYELANYNGGYISLAATGSAHGFDNLKITDLSNIADDAIVSVEAPDDVTAVVGTEVSALQLPATVKATLKNGTKVNVPVKWSPLQYNADETGIYQFTAVLEGNNPAQVGARLYVKVVEKIVSPTKGVKEWKFETPNDLKDFKATYLKNAETGYITEGTPNWYVNSSGKLTRDAFRAVNGDQYKEIAILTYTGEKYTNFELEVEYTQQWQRMMVMFGSEKAGYYIDLNDLYAESNPVAGFVEMEGVRNFIGNLINANFDSNNVEKINNARESGVRLDDYYDKVLSGGNQGKKHTMKIRVVGDQASMWVDDCKEPYVCTLTNYDGGYISLVTTSKNGSFDNLKITRLNAQGEPEATDPAVAANGSVNVSVDANASTELVVPEAQKPEEYKEIIMDKIEKSGIPMGAYVLGGSTILLSMVIGAILILVAAKKKKSEEEK
ncbi:MAG: Ig-like domain-containing protein [Tyzzerella sp.]|nr:Ig-like domain-containing protein [Tyzzerella sp.]